MLNVFRWAIKKGSGPATIPASGSHKNGDWLPTDIYEAEMYMDKDTGVVYTRRGNDIVQLGGDGVSVLSKKIEVSSADVLNLFSSPVELIPAPGVGKFIVPFNIIIYADFNSVAYAGNTTLRFYVQGASSDISISFNILEFTSDLFVELPLVFQTTGTRFAINAPLMLSTEIGNPQNGDSDLVFFINYKIMSFI